MSSAQSTNSTNGEEPQFVLDNTQNMSGTGQVYSFSTMYSVPKNYEDQKPYTIALVQLDEGPIVTAPTH